MTRVVVPRGRHAPPLDVRRARHRARLAEGARHVLARRGRAATTATEIARAAGVSKATFYEHFTDIDNCLDSLFGPEVERLCKDIESVVSAAAERLHHCGSDDAVIAAALVELAATRVARIATTGSAETNTAGPAASGHEIDGQVDIYEALADTKEAA